jgi:hypothetical protein
VCCSSQLQLQPVGHLLTPAHPHTGDKFYGECARAGHDITLPPVVDWLQYDGGIPGAARAATKEWKQRWAPHSPSSPHDHALTRFSPSADAPHPSAPVPTPRQGALSLVADASVAPPTADTGAAGVSPPAEGRRRAGTAPRRLAFPGAASRRSLLADVREQPFASLWPEVTARRKTALFFAGQDGDKPRCDDGSCYVYSLGARQVAYPSFPQWPRLNHLRRGCSDKRGRLPI